ncbi:hypothetical protein BJ165DRAFT_1463882 [Panaeolus papilionaceus]|nr:hypothetical protein BJ165DRAFT_1463882 [Panaeolus papilionaceus]
MKEQSSPFHIYGSPMETDLITPPRVSFSNGQWQPSSTFEGDIYAAPLVWHERRPSDGVNTLMGKLSLNRRQSMQTLMTMDLDRTDTLVHSPFEAESMSLRVESETNEQPTMRTVDFPPTPPLTPPSLRKVQSQSPGHSYTPGSMSRLRSIAPRPIDITTGSLYPTGYAPRIRCVSLPVVSPVSIIEVDGFRGIRDLELLSTARATPHSSFERLRGPWEGLGA